jgi:valyl-tRNA synthetase
VRFEGEPDADATVVLVPGGRLEVAAVVGKAEESARLEQQLVKIAAEICRSEAKLASQGFTGRAPEAMVAKERDKLAANIANRDELAARLAHLRGA